jgi:hypothetical protein
MADAPDLGSGSERIGGSSPLARTIISGHFFKKTCIDDKLSGMKKPNPKAGAAGGDHFPLHAHEPEVVRACKDLQEAVDGYDAFTLMCYKDGERKRIMAKSFEAALKEAEAAVFPSRAQRSTAR